MSKIDIKVGDIVKAYERWYTVTGINDSQLFTKDMIDEDFVALYKEDIVEVKRPTQYKTIYKREEPILDDKEKEYLSAVIKPYKVIGIKKKTG